MRFSILTKGVKVRISLFQKGAFFLLLLFTQFSFAQEFKVHSHNDYKQSIPFWGALYSGVQSIEIDVFLKNKELYVAHEVSEIKASHTLKSLYLIPLQEAIRLEIFNKNESLQILIDLKTEAKETLSKLIEVLEDYPELTRSKAIQFVISGNQPSVEEYNSYPQYLMFDYQKLEDLSPEQWKRVALISQNFKSYSIWNGKGGLTSADKEKVENAIAKAKAFGKPFRFWAAPDSSTAWEYFAHAGVGYINTDQPFPAVDYLSNLSRNTFQNKQVRIPYVPTFAQDRIPAKINHVILMIGDGNGLAQWSSALLANNSQLATTNLKSVGLLKTGSSDNFSTDSAAGGTALATGKKTKNRYIGVDAHGNSLKNMMEILQEKGFSTGIVTTDEINGATPASFYAHQTERDLDKEIIQDLLKSKLNFFAAGGKRKFSSLAPFKEASTLKEIPTRNDNQLAYFLSDSGVPSILKGRGTLLSQVTLGGLEFLKKKKRPVFMMIESAQIDSGGHTRDTGRILTEVLDFDYTIESVLKFADKNPGTLVIITADHETGGFSLPHGDLNSNLVEGAFHSEDHTGIMVPLFAYGPYSDLFSGVYENTVVFHKILEIIEKSETIK